jgi:ATP/ADP translocase/HEAT repeat protein
LAWLNRALHIRSGEGLRAYLMFFYSLNVVGAFICGRIVRDALFLSKSDLSILPWLYVSVFAAVAFPSIIYARFSERFRRDKLIVGLTAFFIVTMVLSWLFISSINSGGEVRNHWFFAFFYVWIEVMGAFIMIQFFTFAGDIFTSREAKRLLPFILGGGTMANIIFGFGSRALVKYFELPTQDLILAVAACLMICIGAVVLLGRSEREALSRAFTGRRSKSVKATADVPAAPNEGGLAGMLARSLPTKHVRFIALIVMITFLTTQFIDFTFKALAQQEFQGSSDELGGFFGNFYGYVGIISVLFQFLITRRLLEHFGVLVALLILPMALLLGSSALAVVGVLGVGVTVLFIVASIAQGASMGLRYTVYDSTMQLMYTPIASAVRSRAKAFIDGILKPLAIGAAGLMLLLLTNLMGLKDQHVSHIGWGTLIFAALWVVLLVGVRKEYVRTLMSTLARRSLDFASGEPNMDNPETIRTLRKELAANEPRRILNGLEIAVKVRSPGLDELLAKLVAHEVPEIRRGALIALGRRGAWQHLAAVHGRLADDEPEVRAAATTSFCAIAREKAIDSTAGLLTDVDAHVREAAIAGLIQHGGLDGILKAAEPLKRLLESEDAEDRVSAAQVLEAIKVASFYQPVLRLINDDDPKVASAALEAAGAMATPELIPSVIYALDRRGLSAAAARALVRMGDAVVPLLGKVIGNSRESAQVRAQIPRILSGIGTEEAIKVLLAQLDREEGVQRYRIATALGRLRTVNPRLVPNKANVIKHLEDELHGAYRSLSIQADLQSEPDLAPMIAALDDRLMYQKRRIFKLLALIHDPGTIQTISRNLESPDATVRDNAVEVIDDLADTAIRRTLVNLMDRSDAAHKLTVVEKEIHFARRSSGERLVELLEDEEPFVVACALHLMGLRKSNNDQAIVEPMLDHRSPLVREAAAQALHRGHGDSALESIRRLVNDPSDEVRRFVASIIPEAASC